MLLKVYSEADSSVILSSFLSGENVKHNEVTVGQLDFGLL